MSTLKTLGLVVRKADYREYDRMLTILTPQWGCISAAVRGCRKTGARMAAAGQPFAFGEFVLSQKGRLCSVTQAQINESFYDLSQDLDKLSAGAFLLDAAAKSAPEGSRCDELFTLVYYTLSFLCYGVAAPGDLVAAFLIKLLDLQGFKPSTTACGVCGKSTFESPRLNKDYGALCHECGPRLGGACVLPLTLEAARRIMALPYGDMDKIKLPSQVEKELFSWLEEYYENHFERKLEYLFKYN